MKASRKDVARVANVSEQTVSYVLNKSRKFSKNITERVHKAVEELSYQPDMIARSMVTKTSKMVCAVVDDIRNPIFGDIVRGFEKEAIANDYFVSIIDAKSDFAEHIDKIISRRFDGMFISLIPSKEISGFLDKIYECNIKIVLSNLISKGKYADKIPCVIVDQRDGVKQIINYLCNNNHKDIVYLSGLGKISYDDRARVFVEEYEKHFGELPFVVENVFPYETSVESGRALTEQLLVSGKKFSAIVCTNDLMAYGVLDVLRKVNIKVPEECSVVGIDDIFFSGLTIPPLTTVSFDRDLYGKQLFNSLKRTIDNADDVKNYTIPTKLVVRNSTSIKADN